MNRKLFTAFFLAFGLLVTTSSALAQGYYYAPQQPEAEPMRRLDLSFSVAQGGYIGYRCDTYDGYCDEFFVAPFDFEIMAGYRLTKFLSLDLALNFSFDYYGYNYYGEASEVFVWTSLRPGIRLLLPTVFRSQVYFRVAVPLTFRVSRFSDREDVFIPGLLFGVGLEWIWGGFGFFIEADILPYFTEVYPGYYLIPAEGRIGVVAHF